MFRRFCKQLFVGVCNLNKPNPSGLKRVVKARFNTKKDSIVKLFSFIQWSMFLMFFHPANPDGKSPTVIDESRLSYTTNMANSFEESRADWENEKICDFNTTY